MNKRLHGLAASKRLKELGYTILSPNIRLDGQGGINSTISSVSIAHHLGLVDGDLIKADMSQSGCVVLTKVEAPHE